MSVWSEAHIIIRGPWIEALPACLVVPWDVTWTQKVDQILGYVELCDKSSRFVDSFNSWHRVWNALFVMRWWNHFPLHRSCFTLSILFVVFVTTQIIASSSGLTCNLVLYHIRHPTNPVTPPTPIPILFLLKQSPHYFRHSAAIPHSHHIIFTLHNLLLHTLSTF